MILRWGVAAALALGISVSALELSACMTRSRVVVPVEGQRAPDPEMPTAPEVEEPAALPSPAITW